MGGLYAETPDNRVAFPSSLAAASHGPTVDVTSPFLFAIRDKPTGALLFLGRVVDPR